MALVDYYYDKALADLFTRYGYLMTNEYIETDILPYYEQKILKDLDP